MEIKDFKDLVVELQAALDIEPIIAQLLVTNGFESINAVANASIEDLIKIDYFNEEIAVEIKQRAEEYLSS